MRRDRRPVEPALDLADGGGSRVWRQYQPSNENRSFIDGAKAEVACNDGAGVTTYEVAIQWAALRVSPDDGAFRAGFAVNDADGGGREDYVWWGGDIGSRKAVDALTTAQLVE